HRTASSLSWIASRMSQSPNPVTSPQTLSLLALATEFLRAGRPAEAIAPLCNAALIDPSNSNIHHDLGLACLEVGRISDAITALQKAVANNPRYGDAFFVLESLLRSKAISPRRSLHTTAQPSCSRC